MKKMQKIWVSWLLVFAMVLTGLVLPDGAVTKAAETSCDLTVKEGASPVVMVKNEYGDDYIADILFNVPDAISTQSKVQAGSPTVTVVMKINSISSDTGSVRAMLYSQDGTYNWNQGEAVDVAAGREITVSYNMSGITWKDSTLAKLGLRFADNAQNHSSISYTITSAKVTVQSSDNGSSTGGGAGEATEDGLAADAREDASKYSVSTSENRQSDGYWLEDTFSVTNHTTEKVSKIQIVLPVSGEPKDLKCFDGMSAVYNRSVGGLIMYYSGEIAAGAKADLPGKLCFNPSGVTVGSAYVRAVNCNPPSGEGTDAGKLNYALTGQTKEIPYEETPFGKHGKLHLKKVDGYGNAPVIVDENDNPYQLRGASTHGLQWDEGYKFANKGTMQCLRDEWGVNLFRLAGYVKEGGYTEGGQARIDEKINECVEAAKELGMYVIVDWHVLTGNPNETKPQAEEFFRKYAGKYKDYGNVIFEICNEPTGTQWYNNGSGNDLYTYCKDIAQIIRDQGSDALIICGTNNWSQDVDDVAKKPLAEDGFENIMYTFHFYAATHGDNLRQKVKAANQAGTPIFVTEFGICSADGNGNFDTANADTWIKLFDSMNTSYTCWSLSNKSEAASYLKSSCTKTTGGYVEPDLATTGIWLINTYRAHQDVEDGTDTGVTPKPGVSADPSASVLPDQPGTTKDPASSAAPGQSDHPQNPSGSASPGQPDHPQNPSVSETPGQPGLSSGTASGTSGTTKPGTSAQPGTSQTPSGVQTTAKPGTATGSNESGSNGSVQPGGENNTGVNGQKFVRLKKKVLKIKKGKKAKIRIKKKMPGDKVKRYKITKGKKYIKVTSKGVVKGRRKGKAVVKVIMKSGASASCRIIVRNKR